MKIGFQEEQPFRCRQQGGVVVSRWAHNSKVGGSKPLSAIFSLLLVLLRSLSQHVPQPQHCCSHAPLRQDLHSCIEHQETHAYYPDADYHDHSSYYVVTAVNDQVSAQLSLFAVKREPKEVDKFVEIPERAEEEGNPKGSEAEAGEDPEVGEEEPEVVLVDGVVLIAEGLHIMELLFKEIEDSLKSGDISRLAQISFSDPILNLGLGRSKQTLIYAAAEIRDQQHCLEAIKLIIFKGGDVNYQDQDKQTVLFYLASFGKKECVHQLLINGANPNHRDINNQTALFYACRESHFEIVTLLHSFGGDLSHNDDLGEIALFYAAKAGSLEIVKYMLENGVNINHQSLGKRTALFYAKKDNKRSIVQFLSSWGKSQTKKAPKKESKKQVKKEEVYMQEQAAPPVKLKRVQKEEKLKNKQDQKQAIEVVDTKISIRLQDLIDPSPFPEPLKREKHKDKEERQRERERDRKLKKKKDQMNAYKLVFTDYIGFSKEITLQEFMEQHPECSEIKLILSNWQYEGCRAEEVNRKIGSNWRRPAMRLLNELWNAKEGVFFQKPVDPIRLKIYDYYDIIKEPMDLSTIKCKLITNTFSSCEEYCRSMLLIFDNCIKYNGVFNVIGQAALKLRETFVRSTGKCEMSELFTRIIQNLSHGNSNQSQLKIQVKRQVKEEFKDAHEEVQQYLNEERHESLAEERQRESEQPRESLSSSGGGEEGRGEWQEREQEGGSEDEPAQEPEQDPKEQTLY